MPLSLHWEADGLPVAKLEPVALARVVFEQSEPAAHAQSLDR